MRLIHCLIASMLAYYFISPITIPSALAFIEREYTTREVLDACTNIIFGEIKSVDKRRLTGIVSVKEDVKGKSHLKEIKINFTTGHYKRGTSPQKMVNLLEPGMPIIVFYQEHHGIHSMCFIDNTWFQLRAYRGKVGVWWSFIHIDPMMSRTFDGKTKRFQKIVREMLEGKMWADTPEDAVKVLVLTGNSTHSTWSEIPIDTNTATYEYQTLRATKKVGERPLVYESIKKQTLLHLNEANILWIGYEEISSNRRYLFSSETEKKIKTFVKNGGIVVVSGQDSSPGKPCGIGWLHGNLTGVESPPSQNFVVTQKGSSLFSYPNIIETGKIFLDDAWTDWKKDDEIFATTPESKELVVGVRRYGEGLYIITGLRNDSQYATAINKALMVNILHYAVNQLK